MASLPRGSLPAAVTGEARPVMAWVDFCRRHPQECAIDTAEASVVALSPRIWQQIVPINRRVNTTITAITDQEHWGGPDRWDLPTDGYGDCEDFQLLKRKLLAEGGLPRRAMRMTVVIDEKGEGHAVLMIRTDRGDYILDNKRNAVLPWHIGPATSTSSAKARGGPALGCRSAVASPPDRPLRIARSLAV